MNFVLYGLIPVKYLFKLKFIIKFFKIGEIHLKNLS